MPRENTEECSSSSPAGITCLLSHCWIPAAQAALWSRNISPVCREPALQPRQTLLSEGSTHHLFSKPTDTSTLFVFSLSCKLPGQTVPVLQKSEGLCWPGGLCCVRRGLQSNPGENPGGAKHHSSTPRLVSSHCPKSKTKLILVVVWVWRGPGRREEAGQGQAAQRKDSWEERNASRACKHLLVHTLKTHWEMLPNP